MAAKKKTKSTPSKFIRSAIKNPGALTKAVGGPPSKNMGKVKSLSKGGGKAAKQAQFYLNVLHPANKKRKKRNGK